MYDDQATGEGKIREGKPYNGVLTVTSEDPVKIENEFKKWEDAHWGAKSVIHKTMKDRTEEGKPSIVLLYYFDNNKASQMRGEYKPNSNIG